eukprot:657522-Pyramimonas_sp.AAC.2
MDGSGGARERRVEGGGEGREFGEEGGRDGRSARGSGGVLQSDDKLERPQWAMGVLAAQGMARCGGAATKAGARTRRAPFAGQGRTTNGECAEVGPGMASWGGKGEMRIPKGGRAHAGGRHRARAQAGGENEERRERGCSANRKPKGAVHRVATRIENGEASRAKVQRG